MDRQQQENSLSDAFGSIWQLSTQKPPALQLNSPFHVAVKHSNSFPFTFFFFFFTDPRLALSLTWEIADLCELLFEHSQLQASQGYINLTPRKSFNSDFWGCLMPFVP